MCDLGCATLFVSEPQKIIKEGNSPPHHTSLSKDRKRFMESISVALPSFTFHGMTPSAP